MDVRLKDGTRLTLRHIRPDDKLRLAQALGRLSDETRRRRFLTAKPRLSAAELRYLTEVDGHHHKAIVAVTPAASGDADADERIVGVGRYVRDRADPTTAEFAVVVADEYQGRGLGSLLAADLAQRAVGRGVRHFTATTFTDNVAVQRLIETIATHLEYRADRDGLTEVVADLAA